VKLNTANKKKTHGATSLALIATAAVLSSADCCAGSLSDAAARMVASGRSGRATHPAPVALNLLPSSLAIQGLTRTKAFGAPSAEKVHTVEVDGSELLPRAGLNLHTAFPIRWESTPANLDPKVVSLARNFRHNGLPIVHLWGSGRNLLALGLNPHGKPGIYFTQNMD
jgi:hypothetical protein